jgi:sec-independent protein translocase protein TatA
MNVLGFGLPELIIIALVLLLFFGSARLPGLFRSIGTSIKELKQGLQVDEDTPTQEKTAAPTPAEKPTVTESANRGDTNNS